MAFQMVCSLLVQMIEEACNHEWAEDCDNEFYSGEQGLQCDICIE